MSSRPHKVNGKDIPYTKNPYSFYHNEVNSVLWSFRGGEIYTQNDKSEKFHVELRVDQILEGSGENCILEGGIKTAWDTSSKPGQ